VRHHDDGLPEVVDAAAQERKHLAARLGVQVAGRLVREDHIGTGQQCPGQRDALLLSAESCDGM
jgi:hypothetical protein